MRVPPLKGLLMMHVPGPALQLSSRQYARLIWPVTPSTWYLQGSTAIQWSHPADVLRGIAEHAVGLRHHSTYDNARHMTLLRSGFG